MLSSLHGQERIFQDGRISCSSMLSSLHGQERICQDGRISCSSMLRARENLAVPPLGTCQTPTIQPVELHFTPPLQARTVQQTLFCTTASCNFFWGKNSHKRLKHRKDSNYFDKVLIWWRYCKVFAYTETRYSLRLCGVSDSDVSNILSVTYFYPHRF